MEYDFEALSYQDIMADIHKRVGVRTKQEEEDEYAAWENVAELYDSKAFEEKIYVPEGLKVQVDFKYCMVLRFRVRDFNFAVRIVKALFKGNLMERANKILETNKETRFKTRMLWFMGEQRTMTRVLEELHKRQVYPHILRNSPFRRDFLHFYKGNFYPMRRGDFKEMVRGASKKSQREHEKLLAVAKR
jgi:hypothetical protein